MALGSARFLAEAQRGGAVGSMRRPRLPTVWAEGVCARNSAIASPSSRSVMGVTGGRNAPLDQSSDAHKQCAKRQFNFLPCVALALGIECCHWRQETKTPPASEDATGSSCFHLFSEVAALEINNADVAIGFHTRRLACSLCEVPPRGGRISATIAKFSR